MTYLITAVLFVPPTKRMPPRESRTESYIPTTYRVYDGTREPACLMKSVLVGPIASTLSATRSAKRIQIHITIHTHRQPPSEF